MSSPLFLWRAGIVASDLPAVTRHVALTLSLHMNDQGGSCWPSMRLLAAETGMREDTVRKHVGALVHGGWLARTDRPGATSLYWAAFASPPDETTPPAAQESCEAPPLPSERSTPPVQPDPTPPVEPESRTSLRSTDEDVNSPRLELVAESEPVDDGFDEFWSVYPARDGKKVNKKEAHVQWSKLSAAQRAAALIGARNYAASGWKPKDAFRWLRDEKWDEWQDAATPEPITLSRVDPMVRQPLPDYEPAEVPDALPREELAARFGQLRAVRP